VLVVLISARQREGAPVKSGCAVVAARAATFSVCAASERKELVARTNNSAFDATASADAVG